MLQRRVTNRWQFLGDSPWFNTHNIPGGGAKERDVSSWYSVCFRANVATAHAKLSYASCGWWGFTTTDDKSNDFPHLGLFCVASAMVTVPDLANLE